MMLYPCNTKTKAAHSCCFIPVLVIGNGARQLVTMTHCTDFKQELQLAEPNVVRSELKCAIGDTRWSTWADKHHVVTISLVQCLQNKWPQSYSHLTRMFSSCAPCKEDWVNTNVTLVVVGLKNAQSVQLSSILFQICQFNMHYMHNMKNYSMISTYVQFLLPD